MKAIKEFKDKNSEELKKNLVELKNKLTKMRFEISGKQVKNHRDVRKIKKSIARINTLLNVKNN